MKGDEESQSVNSSSGNNGGGVMVMAGKGRYKVWALAGILLLAFWSVVTGSVTLQWSDGHLGTLSDDVNSFGGDDLDILELEEREKLVRNMWNVYTHSTTIRLPKFWLEAFKAAYEDLTSEVSDVRDSAISEIAKLSIRSINLESPPDKLKSTGGRSKFSKETKKEKTGTD